MRSGRRREGTSPRNDSRAKEAGSLGPGHRHPNLKCWRLAPVKKRKRTSGHFGEEQKHSPPSKAGRKSERESDGPSRFSRFTWHDLPSCSATATPRCSAPPSSARRTSPPVDQIQADPQMNGWTHNDRGGVGGESDCTHAPLVGVPGVKPAGEGGGLETLLDGDHGRVLLAARRVGAQVLAGAIPRLLGLRRVGRVPQPQENLRKMHGVVVV